MNPELLTPLLRVIPSDVVTAFLATVKEIDVQEEDALTQALVLWIEEQRGLRDLDAPVA